MTKNMYTMPHIDNFFDQLRGAAVFSKIDISSDYLKLRIWVENIPMISFRTRMIIISF